MSKRRQLTAVKEYFESGVLVNLPDKQHFRFENLKTYQKLSGQGLKEMDFCWLEQIGGKGRSEPKKTLFLMEIWSDPSSSKAVENLTGKVVDSLLMLASLWLLDSYLGQEVPGDFHTPPDLIKLFVILTKSSSDSTANLKDRLNGQLKSRLRLFNIEEVMVVDTNDRGTIKQLGLESYLPLK